MARASGTGHGHPAQRDGEEQDEHVSQPIAGQRHAGQSREARRVVHHGITRGGRDHGEWHRDEEAQDERGEGECERGRKSQAKLVVHRLPTAIRLAEVTARSVGEPSAVPHDERAIKAEVVTQAHHVGLRWLLTGATEQHDLRRISRSERAEGECHERDKEPDDDTSGGPAGKPFGQAHLASHTVLQSWLSRDGCGTKPRRRSLIA